MEEVKRATFSIHPVTMEEVKRATFSIHPQSAPGDDGMTAKFFQSFWNILSGDVFRAVKSFFSGGRILKGFNHTQICLIPKISDAKDMTQVRPISLSSVFYKIISKVFVHRLQGMMNRLISPMQSAFIKGILISDNILIAHECMHYLKNKKRGLENEMALKLDMSKAYDRVEWHFLWFILEKFGFDSRWIMWISISGQRVNLNKSAVFFSHNTPSTTRTLLANSMNINHIGAQDKYLGLPSTVSKSKKASFSIIKEKVRKRIQGWKRNLLSSGGRHVLLKAVGEAIPIYTLSCFKLPDSLISEIHSLLSQFWWGQKGSERRMAWISWDTMTRPRKEGGLGFKDLRIQNLALLGKQFWRLVTQPTSLLSKILRGKYFSNGNAITAEIGVLPSWGWRSILEGRKIVEKGLNWAVGTGENIRTFEDPWLPPPYPLKIYNMPNRQAISELVPRVKDLITEDRNWNQNLIQELFPQDVANRILSVKIQQSRDKLQWDLNKSKQYDTVSGYRIGYLFYHPPLELCPNYMQQKKPWIDP
ncbi:uncharacterized protein LOC107481144 [Arachis duranensis]|uniref:Uncharacterized protein LOC107481144 n=1 Tax=Arachis duranensis TaxID=130453 RepID=A0A6P4CTI4_ARADU|nr:uncharacterized protein LOC107481144 [Arachis duranensis]